MTVTLPNARQSSVSPVGVRVVVSYAEKMLGSSSGHIPFGPSSRVLISLSKDRFVTSTCLLACGWAGKV